MENHKCEGGLSGILMSRLTQVGGTRCPLASTDLEEAAAERGARLLGAEALLTCGTRFRGGGTGSLFEFDL